MKQFQVSVVGMLQADFFSVICGRGLHGSTLVLAFILCFS